MNQLLQQSLVSQETTPDLVRSLILDPQSIDENLNCGICSELPIQPKECENCQHLFCLDCIEAWTKRNKQCPFKCLPTEIKLKEPHRFVKSTINSIKIKCANKECDAIIEFGSFNNHLKDCEHSTSKCINEGCQEQIKNKNKEQHLNKCPHRIITCEQCQEQYKIQVKHNCITYLKKLNDQMSEIIKQLQKMQLETNQKLNEQQLQIKGLQEQNRQLQNIQKKCKNGHMLNWCQRYNVACSLCSKISSIVRYECTQCKFFACQNCLKPSFGDQKCPSQHPLIYTLNARQTISCDFCSLRPYQLGGGVWSDRECDFDICQPCYSKYQQ